MAKKIFRFKPKDWNKNGLIYFLWINNFLIDFLDFVKMGVIVGVTSAIPVLFYLLFLGLSPIHALGYLVFAVIFFVIVLNTIHIVTTLKNYFGSYRSVKKKNDE